MKHAISGKAELGKLGSMPDCSEGGLYRIARPNALQMFFREVIERHQFLTTLL
tara:strand:- start:3967 stop:4125 length:159 start_codon:yes stop_codon:yes gene_type:complete